MKRGSDEPRDFGQIAEELPPYLQQALVTAQSLPDDGVGVRHVADDYNPEEQRLSRARSLVETRGVPFEAAQAIAFDEVRDTKATQLYRRWARAGRYGGVLIISAPFGHGKTFAASLAVADGPPRDYPWGGRRWPDRHAPRFITAGDLAFMGGYDNPRFNALTDASVLAIDDLGSEYSDPKGMLQAKLNHIVAKREASFVWTVLTTNLKWDDFLQRFGSNRIAARMQKPNSGWARIEDQDYRRSA